MAYGDTAIGMVIAVITIVTVFNFLSSTSSAVNSFKH